MKSILGSFQCLKTFGRVKAQFHNIQVYNIIEIWNIQAIKHSRLIKANKEKKILNALWH